jgi:hypothetical protein
MSKQLLFLFLVTSTFTVTAQIINGIVYDAESTIKGANVLNLTQKRVTATNSSGRFSIKAKVTDTLYFESLFHKPKFAIVDKNYFKTTYVFELTKIINELDEVFIKGKPKAKRFESEAYNQSMNRIIDLDKKAEPQKYTATPKFGLDFIQVFMAIGNLFKKEKSEIPNTLNYKQLKLLFETNSLFNEQMLFNNLKIPKNYQSLFFEFCESKNITEALLDFNKRLELLNLFTLYSQEFLIIIEMAEEQKKE